MKNATKQEILAELAHDTGTGTPGDDRVELSIGDIFAQGAVLIPNDPVTIQALKSAPLDGPSRLFDGAGQPHPDLTPGQHAAVGTFLPARRDAGNRVFQFQGHPIDGGYQIAIAMGTAGIQRTLGTLTPTPTGTFKFTPTSPAGAPHRAGVLFGRHQYGGIGEFLACAHDMQIGAGTTVLGTAAGQGSAFPFALVWDGCVPVLELSTDDPDDPASAGIDVRATPWGLAYCPALEGIEMIDYRGTTEIAAIAGIVCRTSGMSAADVAGRLDRMSDVFTPDRDTVAQLARTPQYGFDLATLRTVVSSAREAAAGGTLTGPWAQIVERLAERVFTGYVALDQTARLASEMHQNQVPSMDLPELARTAPAYLKFASDEWARGNVPVVAHLGAYVERATKLGLDRYTDAESVGVSPADLMDQMVGSITPVVRTEADGSQTIPVVTPEAIERDPNLAPHGLYPVAIVDGPGATQPTPLSAAPGLRTLTPAQRAKVAGQVTEQEVTSTAK